MRSVPIDTTYYIDVCMYMHIVYAPPSSGHIHVDSHHPFLHTRIYWWTKNRRMSFNSAIQLM